MALSEIFPKYSFLFVGWLVGCFGVLGCLGFFFWHGEQYFQKSRKKQLHHHRELYILGTPFFVLFSWYLLRQLFTSTASLPQEKLSKCLRGYEDLS